MIRRRFPTPHKSVIIGIIAICAYVFLSPIAKRTGETIGAGISAGLTGIGRIIIALGVFFVLLLGYMVLQTDIPNNVWKALTNIVSEAREITAKLNEEREDETLTETVTVKEPEIFFDPTTDGYLFPSDEREITFADLGTITEQSGYSKGKITRLVLDELYARYNCVFDDYQEYFDSKDWYTQDSKSSVDFRAYEFTKNPAVETYNAILIAAYEYEHMAEFKQCSDLKHPRITSPNWSKDLGVIKENDRKNGTTVIDELKSLFEKHSTIELLKNYANEFYKEEFAS